MLLTQKNIKNMDFKKNILTRILALICLAGLIIGFRVTVSHLENTVSGSERIPLGVTWSSYAILLALFVGFLQISVSITRWKKLTTLDKFIPVIILISFFILFFSFLHEWVLMNFS